MFFEIESPIGEWYREGWGVKGEQLLIQVSLMKEIKLKSM